MNDRPSPTHGVVLDVIVRPTVEPMRGFGTAPDSSTATDTTTATGRDTPTRRTPIMRNPLAAAIVGGAITVGIIVGIFVWPLPQIIDSVRNSSASAALVQAQADRDRLVRENDELKRRSGGGGLGSAQAAPAAPPRVPGLKGMTAAERQQLADLALKRAPEVLPPPPGGVVGTMTLTERTGTVPAGCHRAAGTKHDSLAGGTFQIWKRC